VVISNAVLLQHVFQVIAVAHVLKKMCRTSEIEWPVSRHSRDKKDKGMFWKGENLCVAGGPEGSNSCHNMSMTK